MQQQPTQQQQQQKNTRVEIQLCSETEFIVQPSDSLLTHQQTIESRLADMLGKVPTGGFRLQDGRSYSVPLEHKAEETPARTEEDETLKLDILLAPRPRHNRVASPIQVTHDKKIQASLAFTQAAGLSARECVGLIRAIPRAAQEEMEIMKQNRKTVITKKGFEQLAETLSNTERYQNRPWMPTLEKFRQDGGIERLWEALPSCSDPAPTETKKRKRESKADKEASKCARSVPTEEAAASEQEAFVTPLKPHARPARRNKRAPKE